MKRRNYTTINLTFLKINVITADPAAACVQEFTSHTPLTTCYSVREDCALFPQRRACDRLRASTEGRRGSAGKLGRSLTAGLPREWMCMNVYERVCVCVCVRERKQACLMTAYSFMSLTPDNRQLCLLHHGSRIITLWPVRSRREQEKAGEMKGCGFWLYLYCRVRI